MNLQAPSSDRAPLRRRMTSAKSSQCFRSVQIFVAPGPRGLVCSIPKAGMLQYRQTASRSSSHSSELFGTSVRRNLLIISTRRSFSSEMAFVSSMSSSLKPCGEGQLFTMSFTMSSTMIGHFNSVGQGGFFISAKHLATHLGRGARKPLVLAACQMAVLSARCQLMPADAGGHSQGNFRFPMCTILPAGLSQYAAHASISLRRFSSASRRR
jgi:hypothetical protein